MISTTTLFLIVGLAIITITLLFLGVAFAVRTRNITIIAGDIDLVELDSIQALTDVDVIV